MTEYNIPVVGPGSQPEEVDGADLSFMGMPAEMSTYSMPDVAESITTLSEANEVLLQIQQLLDSYQQGGPVCVIELPVVDADNSDLIDQVLGEGEVSIIFHAEKQIRIQESVLAGVWRVQYLGTKGDILKDTVEVGDIPAVVREMTFAGRHINKVIEKQECPEGVGNAIPLLSELNDSIAVSDAAAEPYIINLTLLPQSDADLEYLSKVLGKGRVTILSRGYGNCRVMSTGTYNVWWVQYFNSQDAIILNTLEVTPVPIVVCASMEDIIDSAQRLQEIREVYA